MSCNPEQTLYHAEHAVWGPISVTVDLHQSSAAVWVSVAWYMVHGNARPRKPPASTVFLCHQISYSSGTVKISALNSGLIASIYVCKPCQYSHKKQQSNKLTRNHIFTKTGIAPRTTSSALINAHNMNPMLRWHRKSTTPSGFLHAPHRVHFHVKSTLLRVHSTVQPHLTSNVISECKFIRLNDRFHFTFTEQHEMTWHDTANNGHFTHVTRCICRESYTTLPSVISLTTTNRSNCKKMVKKPYT